MKVKEERRGFEDQSVSDFAHARAKEAHPQAREEVSQKQGDEWMKRISKKLDILTEPGGVATRDEGLFSYLLFYVLLQYR